MFVKLIIQTIKCQNPLNTENRCLQICMGPYQKSENQKAENQKAENHLAEII